MTDGHGRQIDGYIGVYRLSLVWNSIRELTTNSIDHKIRDYNRDKELKPIKVTSNGIVIDGVTTVLAAMAMGINEILHVIKDKQINTIELIPDLEVEGMIHTKI